MKTLIERKQVNCNVEGDKHYKHEQKEHATLWTVYHNLNKLPSVQVNYLDNIMFGKIQHINQNTLTIEFCNPCRGVAICN